MNVKDSKRAETVNDATAPADAVFSPGARLASLAKERQSLLVNVGIDFGTSSTKVIFTDHDLSPRFVCTFGDNPEGYPPVCLPSCVGVVDGRVYFGGDAERLSGGVVLRSFKRCMGCGTGTGTCHACPNSLDGATRAGLFRLGDGDDSVVTAKEVTAWYLGHVIHLARARVERRFPDMTPKLTYQTSAPLTSCDDSNEKVEFERAIHIASLISTSIEQGMPLSVLRALYEDGRYESLPPEQRRDTSVIPETHAAVVGFVQTPQSRDGLYAVVDVGAGTTDISFMRLYRDEPEGGLSYLGAAVNADRELPERQDPVLSYYSSDVIPTGGDAVDVEILAQLNGRNGDMSSLQRSALLSKIRIAKQSESAVLLAPGVSTDRATCQKAAVAVAGAIFREYEKTWAKAYQKEVRARSWERFTVYLCGGGSRLRPAFPQTFRAPPKRNSRIVQSVDVAEFDSPLGLVTDDDVATGIENFGYLLLVAYGLASFRARIPKWILESLVEPLVIEPEPEKVVYDDDYGKDGQWW